MNCIWSRIKQSKTHTHHAPQKQYSKKKVNMKRECVKLAAEKGRMPSDVVVLGE